MNFDLLSIFLVVTLCQGAFILSVLAIKHSLRSSQHLFLFLMVLALVWFQAEFLSVRFPFGVDVNLFYGTRYGAWLVLGPLYYFYVRSITGEKLLWRTALPHFAPFVLLWLILPLFTTSMIGRQQVDYGMLSTFYHPFIDRMVFMQRLYAAVYAIQFIHVLVYLVISFVDIYNYERSLKGNYSTVDTTTMLWLKTLNILLITVVLFVTMFLAIFFIYRTYNRDLDYLYVIPMAVFTYLISYKLAGVQWTVRPAEERSKYERTALRPEVAVRIRRQLEEFMTDSKPFLSNELRLQELADQLNVPSYQLSQVINEQFGVTFFDYINKYRVEEAKRLIVAEPGATLLEIAFKAGFNNKTSFSNAFKKFTTQTAGEFKKRQQSL